jgi:hypothetical protein
MNAFLVTGTNRKAIASQLVDVLAIVFAPASAKASVSGENRGKAAIALANVIPQLGKFDAIVMDDDEGTITIKNENLPDVLARVADAYGRMEALRNDLEGHEERYKLIRSFVPKNPATGKRGRKASNFEDKYAVDAKSLFA